MSYPEINLDGAVALVTGGGRGIGAATAELLRRHGATVWLGDLDVAAARATADDLGAHAHALDVTDRASFDTFARAALTTHGRIDVLVNNAGVMPLGDFLTEHDATSRTTFDVNVWGLINGMRTVLPHLIERGRGHVINVTSMAGKIPIPGMAVYNASKFAALGVSLAVREEYRTTGVSVSTVLPAAVRTRLASGVPLARGLPTVDPDDVATAIVGSVATRRAEIPVPGYLAGWNLLGAVVPEPLMRLGRRIVGDRRALTSVDHSIRDTYERTVRSQARARDRT
ncbi:SDR family oxidoreductase [Haloechinothrix halophila]|uniref:SDR family oxidoreductase n=1 Tax=Haloechinothrix halophila TaxID=1069073 RepID=UPI0004119E30|nr:SDR family oxidoreductase [Haloechinothrix halophila]